MDRQLPKAKLPAVKSNAMAAIEQILINGDLGVLTPEQRVIYYNKVCETVGLNPVTRPFDYIRLNGKLVLYANKGCAEQLRQIHAISIRITSRETIEGVYVVTAQAERKTDGRVDEDSGAVPIQNLRGDVLANAMLKCTTKAKRRVTLSICGLNMLDETEVETIKPNAEGIRSDGHVGPEQPGPDDGVQEAGVVIPYGPLARQFVHKADPVKLRDYVMGIEEKARVTNKPIPKWAQPLIEAAEPIIARFENGDDADDGIPFTEFEESRVP